MYIQIYVFINYNANCLYKLLYLGVLSFYVFEGNCEGGDV